MLEVALLLTSTTFVVLAGFLLTVLMRPTSLAEVVIGTGALPIALIAVDSLLVGGLLHSYRPVPLLLGALGLLAIVASPLLGSKGRLAAADAIHLLGGGLSDLRREPRRHPVLVLLGIAVIAAYGVRAYLSVRLPNTDWDGLYYHLVGIDEWITRERITHSSLVLWADVYPQSVELFVGWTCVHLGNTMFAGVSQLPIFLLGAAATAGLARRVGARRPHAVLAGLLFLATPLVLAQFGTNYVDAGAAAFGLAALYFVTGLQRAVDLNPHSRALWAARLVTAGMVAGLACAAKSSNLLLAPFLVACVLAIQWSSDDRASASTAGRVRHWLRRVWSGAPGVLLFGVAAVTVGGYWYLRTWATYGNPLYPFAVAGLPGPFPVDKIITPHIPAQLEGHHGVLQVVMSWASDFHPHHTVDYGQRLGGLGMQWTLFLLPLAILATVVWWRAGRRGPAGLLMLLLLVAMVTSPAPWWARYQLLNAGLAAALSGYAMTWLAEKSLGREPSGPWIRRPVVLRTASSIALIGVVGTSMWWATRSLPYQVEGRANFLSLHAAFELAAREDRMDVVFPWYLFRPMDQVPTGSTVAVLGDGGRLWTHPIFGNRYEHDVVAVGPMRTASELSDALRDRNIRYVVLDDGTPFVGDVIDDSRRFRLLSGEGTMGQSRLFEYCEPSSPRKDQRCSSR